MCLFCIIWIERKRRTFDDKESSVRSLKKTFPKALCEWTRGFSHLSLLDFIDCREEVLFVVDVVLFHFVWFFLSFESCKYNDIAYILGRIDLSQGWPFFLWVTFSLLFLLHGMKCGTPPLSPPQPLPFKTIL